MSPFRIQGHTLFSNGVPSEPLLVPSISLRPPIAGQSGSNYQMPRGLLQWPDGYVGPWANSQFTDPRTATDTTGYYPLTQPTQVDTSAGGTSHPTACSSPFYPMPTQVDLTVQPSSYQSLSYNTQYSSNRRPSAPQVHSPTPQQPTNYPSVVSSSGSDSSYSHPGPSPLQLRRPASPPVNLQRPQPQIPFNRIPDTVSVTLPQDFVDPHPPMYSPVVASPTGPGQASLAQSPPSLGEVPPYLSADSYPRSDGPSFPIPEPFLQPAEAKGKKAMRNHPYPRSGQKTGKKASLPNELLKASSSRITLDTPAPPAARGKTCKTQTPVSPPPALWVTITNVYRRPRNGMLRGR